MKVVIIEDERLTAEDLADILLSLSADIKIVKILSSVTEAIEYFNRNKFPDLIFSDIELGDGHSFEIFRQVNIDVPVIFCTAFDKYAIEAFNNHGIGYILKPFNRKTISEAINKFTSFKNMFVVNALDLENIFSSKLKPDAALSASLLVMWKDKIIPVKIADIALFIIDYKHVTLITLDNVKYPIGYTLDELEIMCGSQFYRATRQHLVNRVAIKEAVHHHARKLFIQLTIDGNFDITVSKVKIPEFLSWLRS
jgi:DNA-binding LytR/AlgR family response regulator